MESLIEGVGRLIAFREWKRALFRAELDEVQALNWWDHERQTLIIRHLSATIAEIDGHIRDLEAIRALLLHGPGA